MLRKIFAIAAWLSLAFIVFATLSPAGLRPQVAPAGLERMTAFALTGLFFGLAYPRRRALVVALVLCSACVLELAQLITPERHGRLSDLLVKLAGGVAGILVAQGLNRLRG
ncbi:MAG: VanZ family protein [Afipia sp.]|nr:VanZ family protein [Afipia sp.]OJW64370.1 MAG: VanZ family protein [Afipia sp. 64-13]